MDMAMGQEIADGGYTLRFCVRQLEICRNMLRKILDEQKELRKAAIT